MKKKKVFLGLMIAITILSSIFNLASIILYQSDKSFLINFISGLFVFVFVIFYTFIALNSKKYRLCIFSTFIILFFNIFRILSNSGCLDILTLPHASDLTNKSLVEVIKWGKKNNIEIKQDYEYSDTIAEYNIIGQSIQPNALIKNKKSITVTVSEGPNPNKDIVIPSMIGASADKGLKFVLDNKLENVIVDFIFSDKEKNSLIEQDTSGSIKRNTPIKFVFSMGDEESIEDTKLIDLRGKSLIEAEFFLKQNNIKYEVKRKFSKVKNNYVIKTSKEVKSIIKKDSDETLILYVSKGKKVVVPDLEKYSVEKITNWVIKNNLKLEFIEKYDDHVKKNSVLSVNYKKGDIIEQKTLITVIISKGKIIMEKFDSPSDFRIWAEKYNITYEEKYEFSDSIPEGKIISFSHKLGDVIKNNDTIIMTVSKGSKTTVPNVVNLTKEEAIKKLEQAKIKYNFVYEASTKTRNTVIKQSLASGSEVAENITITLTLSNGKKPTNNSSSNTNNASTNNQVSCDSSKGDYLDIQAGDTGADTISIIKSQNPNHKFNFVKKASCPNGNTTRGSVCEAIDGMWTNYCDTITITVVE